MRTDFETSWSKHFDQGSATNTIYCVRKQLYEYDKTSDGCLLIKMLWSDKLLSSTLVLNKLTRPGLDSKDTLRLSTNEAGVPNLDAQETSQVQSKLGTSLNYNVVEFDFALLFSEADTFEVAKQTLVEVLQFAASKRYVDEQVILPFGKYAFGKVRGKVELLDTGCCTNLADTKACATALRMVARRSDANPNVKQRIDTRLEEARSDLEYSNTADLEAHNLVLTDVRQTVRRFLTPLVSTQMQVVLATLATHDAELSRVLSSSRHDDSLTSVDGDEEVESIQEMHFTPTAVHTGQDTLGLPPTPTRRDASTSVGHTDDKSGEESGEESDDESGEESDDESDEESDEASDETVERMDEMHEIKGVQPNNETFEIDDYVGSSDTSSDSDEVAL